MSSLPPTAGATVSRKGSKKFAKRPSTKVTEKPRDIPIQSPPPPHPSAAAAVIFDTPGSLGILAHILSFVGKHQYRFVAPTNRRFNEAYLINFHDRTTALDASTLARTKICWEECDHDAEERWIECHYHREDTKDELVLLESAESHRDIPSLQYLFNEHESFGHGLCSEAARGGDFAKLCWLRSIGCPWDVHTCTEAANRGDLKMLQWCRANGCPWDVESINYPALRGHLHVVKWSCDNGCPWNEYSCSCAALHGHLNVLKWLREKGCPWDVYTLEHARLHGHRNVVQWCLENGVPPRFGECYCKDGETAQEKALFLKWCQGNGCTRGTTGR